MENTYTPNNIAEELQSIPADYVQEHLKRTINLLSSSELQSLGRIFRRFAGVIPSEMSEEQKAVLLYEVVTRSVCYSQNEKSESRFVFVSALLAGEAVCMGIAELYAFLCNWAGIRCKIVIGYAWNHFFEDGSLHAWNMVRFTENGSEQWFHCDPTWDLSELNRTEKEYLLKGDTYMKLHRHIWLPERYPVCRTDAGKVGRLNEKGVERTCQILKEVIASILKQTRSQ